MMLMTMKKYERTVKCLPPLLTLVYHTLNTLFDIFFQHQFLNDFLLLSLSFMNKTVSLTVMAQGSDFLFVLTYNLKARQGDIFYKD